MRWPLRHQIMLPLVVVALASLSAVGAINAVLAARHTRERIERQLQGVVGVLAKSSFPLSNAVLRQMRDLSSAEFVLTSDAGTLLATSFRKAPRDLPEIELIAPADEVVLGQPITVGGERYFHAASSLPARNETARSRRLHILFPESEYSRSWREAFFPSLIVAAVTMAAVAAVARVLAGRISRTTSRLGRDVLRMAEGDFTPAAVTGTDDEIRDLSEAVNRMAEMLAAYERQVRRTEQMRTAALLGAGLAHEMRNAATGCRMALDIHAEDCNGSGDADSLLVAKRQLQLMETQLQRFLRAGKPAAEAAVQEFDLARLVDDMLNLVSHAAKHAATKVEWSSPEGALVVSADREAIGQVALNLLLNAIEAVQKVELAAPRRIGVTLQAVKDRAELVVSDSGPGPHAAISGELFDPFVTSKPEGVGLGLAVAKEVIEAHGGTIGWRRLDGETRLDVSIPLVRKAAAHVEDPGR